MKAFVYKMCGCEIIEITNPARLRGQFLFMHGDKVVACFKDRKAAIRYLAKEFVIPKRHE